VQRSDRNPILTRQDIRSDNPDLPDVSSVFNPGAIRRGDVTSLLLRVQNRGRETFLVRADSDDGISFRINTEVSITKGLEALGESIYHIYDPRLAMIDGQLLVTLAVDTSDGCRAVVARSDDLTQLDVIGQMWDGEARNGVLFPQKIDGKCCGLVRPNVPVTGETAMSGSEIWLVESSDLITWRSRKMVMSGRPHYWDELIGSGPPPIRTREGWLHIYHGVATHFASANIYQAGVCLLDLDDPSVVIARGRSNILEPRENYELVGQVPNVVFQTGLIVGDSDSDGCARPDSDVTLYYGAADTVVAVATSTVRELLDQCYAGRR
jgi:predicted GH43/DUF377 family glycosyl hydrolase